MNTWFVNIIYALNTLYVTFWRQNIISYVNLSHVVGFSFIKILSNWMGKKYVEKWSKCEWLYKNYQWLRTIIDKKQKQRKKIIYLFCSIKFSLFVFSSSQSHCLTRVLESALTKEAHMSYPRQLTRLDSTGNFTKAYIAITTQLNTPQTLSHNYIE